MGVAKDTAGHVLLVDDDPENLELMDRILRSQLRTTLALGFDEARARLRATHFDCLVTDVRMPGGSGLDLLVEAGSLWPGIGRVAVSGYVESEEILRAMNEGLASSFVVKPFEPEKLRRAVLRALRVHPPRVLIVDDDRFWRKTLEGLVSDAGMESASSPSGADALRRLEQATWDVVLLDLHLEGESGFDVLARLRARAPNTPILSFSATESPQIAAELRRQGATGFLPKSAPHSYIVFEILRVLEEREKGSPANHDSAQGDFLGESKAMQKVRALLESVAPTQATVLLRGETGTGKEQAARYLHQRSTRSDQPFLALNCAALGDVLFESEMFGHERGAFTGATEPKPGFCEVANEGTLFLDEVGELSIGAQAKLLRFLQSGEYIRLGGTRVLQSNARVIAATNRDLAQMVEAGDFRADLFHRLNVFEVTMPPLRDRIDDLPMLVAHLVEKTSLRHGIKNPMVSSGALQALTQRRWEGNVRELENTLERAMILTNKETLEAHDFSEQQEIVPNATGPISPRTLKETIRDVVTAAERRYLTQLLTQTQGRVAQAARIAGLDRRNFYRKLREHKIAPASFRD